MEQHKFKYLTLLCLALFLVCFSPSAQALNAHTDKIMYVTNESISISGVVESTNSSANVTAYFYNETGGLVDSSIASAAPA